MKLIKLYADWCGPCKALENLLEEHNVKHDNVDISTPEGEALTLKYNIRSIPALLLLDEDDNLIKKVLGIPTVDALKSLTNEVN